MPYNFIEGQRRSNLSPDPSVERKPYTETLRKGLTMDPKAMFLSTPPLVAADAPDYGPSFTPIIYLDASSNYWDTDLPIQVYYEGNLATAWRNRINGSIIDNTGNAIFDSYGYNRDSNFGGNVEVYGDCQIFFGDGSNQVLDLSEDVSLIFWVNPIVSSGTPLGLFTNNGAPGAYSPGIRLFINTWPDTGDGKLILEIADQSGTIATGLASNSGAITESMQQVVLTLSKSKTTAKMYVNGEIIASKTDLETTDWNNQSLSYLLSLSYNYYYLGNISIFKMFTQEISSNYVISDFETNRSRFGI